MYLLNYMDVNVMHSGNIQQKAVIFKVIKEVKVT